MTRISLVALLTFLVTAGWTQDQNRAAPEPPPSYHKGERIAPETFIYDVGGRYKRLLDLVQPDTKVIYLLIFGGPALVPESGTGGFWCQDSFNDMPTSTYLYRKYHNQGVCFIPVACPPVYDEEDYGFAGNTFLALLDTTEQWRREYQAFVNAAMEMQIYKTMVFEQIYFDPKFRLSFNYKKLSDGLEVADAILPWMGKFKPASDDQSYSVPVIWLLSPAGEILHEPFVGNRFGSTTQHLNYTVREVEAALQQALAATNGQQR